MIVELLVADKEMLKRMQNGCAHYGLKMKYTKRTAPYAHVEVNDEQDVVSIFWLGANLSQPIIDTPRLQSVF